MKVSFVFAGLVWPALVFGQQVYTNADLGKFDVPGAYTNQDLRRLPPLSVQREPAVRMPSVAPQAPAALPPYQESYDGLKINRDALAFELDLELQRVAFSESAFAGDTRSIEPRLGYAARASSLILELKKRVALLDRQIDELLDQARRAGVSLDQR